MRRIGRDERVDGPSTPGMDRFTALDSARLWAGGARTDPGSVSGWHHHGDHESVIYVLSGALRMEFGPGGTETFDAGPGDFVFVGRGEIHREANPTDGPADLIVVRAGSGPSVVNVEGPSPA
ncbi:MAG TPA: cupin domain-containing protein [Actinomycetota bacterium]|nr:cupin domain-containing protein [Actinomycetota bacterium]